MKPRRELLIASEGIPVLLGLAAIIAAILYFGDVRHAVLPFLLLFVLVLVFRDPVRVIPAAPLGVVSPVDGTVIGTSTVQDGPLGAEVHCVCIRVKGLGTYTARAPVEGKVMELHRIAQTSGSPLKTAGGLWIRTDEGDDVLLQFRGYRFGIPPRAFLRYGERVGQGERCAWLRLTRIAEVRLPGSGRVLVEKDDEVSAGTTVLARLAHHQEGSQ